MAAATTGRPTHYKSLREHTEVLRAIDELQEINREVDWNLEIGAITRRIYEIGGPAALFNRIKGIEPGFRVLGAPAGVSARPGQPMARVATSIGLEPRATPLEVVEALACAHDRPPIPPTCGECPMQGKHSDWRGRRSLAFALTLHPPGRWWPIPRTPGARR